MNTEGCESEADVKRGKSTVAQNRNTGWSRISEESRESAIRGLLAFTTKLFGKKN